MLFLPAAVGSWRSQAPRGTDIQEDWSQKRSGARTLKCPLVLVMMKLCLWLNFQCGFEFKLCFCLAAKVLSPFTIDHAIYARDALAKAIYGQTFTWLVNRINESMENKVRRGARDKCRITGSEDEYLLTLRFHQDPSKKTVIGLLDIYGFEVFYVNR